MDDYAQLAERLLQLESAVVADVLEAAGLDSQSLAADIRPVRTGSKMAGPAICAAGSQNYGERKPPSFELDDTIYPGGILIIDTDRCERGAIIGDNMVASMVNRGAAGFIVDGGIRDYADFVELPQPVFYRYACPISAHRDWGFTSFEQPITLRGMRDDVTINPGDLLLADGDGVVVVPRRHALQIIEDAEVHMATENSIKQALLRGEDRRTVTSAAGRLKHVRPLSD
ncbi:MAG: RraA family protein [Parahaliea sp.]